MVYRMYSPELQLNKANTSDTEAPFLDLHLPISNGFVSSKIYDKRDDFDFDKVNFPFLDGDVSCSTSYGVNISHSHVINLKKIKGRADFSDQFRKIIERYKRIGYNINIMRQSACLVFNPITVNNFASLFNCTPVGRASDSMVALT